MADPTDKLPGQAPGKYYVDSNCIACEGCGVWAWFCPEQAIDLVDAIEVWKRVQWTLSAGGFVT